jgi:hypothetical protein
MLIVLLVYQKILNQAGFRNINVISYQPFFADDITGLLSFISYSAIRIVLVGVTGTDQIHLMHKALNMGLVSNEYVWLLMEDNSPALLDTVKPNEEALDGLFLFDMKTSLYGYPPFETFLDSWQKLDPKV